MEKFFEIISIVAIVGALILFVLVGGNLINFLLEL